MKQAIVETFPPARVDGTVTGGKTTGKHKSRENAVALTHMETAQLWLGKREAERAERGVLGTHAK